MKWTLSDPRINFTSDSKDGGIVPVSSSFVNRKMLLFRIFSQENKSQLYILFIINLLKSLKNLPSHRLSILYEGVLLDFAMNLRDASRKFIEQKSHASRRGKRGIEKSA